MITIRSIIRKLFIFSYFMNGSAAGLMFISVLFGLLVWKHLKSVDIFDKEVDEESTENNATKEKD